jgi:hypothetical protein
MSRRSINLREVKKRFLPEAQEELTNIMEGFDEEFKDILEAIDYESISDVGRRRPISFLRAEYCELINEISPIFGHKWKDYGIIGSDNTKLIDQYVVAAVLNLKERSVLAHHHKKYDFDKLFFKPLVERAKNVRITRQRNILKLRSLVDAYNEERAKDFVNKNRIGRRRLKELIND